MTGLPPEGYIPPPPGGTPPPPQPPTPDPNLQGAPQGQPANPYGQSYQPYIPGQSPPPPQTPQQDQKRSRNSTENTPAKLAMIFGALVFVCGFLTGIPAIILGVVGRKKAEELGGDGMTQANVGLGLGIFNLVGTIIVTALVFTGAMTFPGFDNINSSKNTSTGAVVLADDVELVDSSVEIGEGALVKYTAQIKNKTASKTAFSADIECEGGGEKLTSTVDTKAAEPEEIVDAVAEIQFSPAGSYLSVFCSVTGMKFKD